MTTLRLTTLKSKPVVDLDGQILYVPIFLIEAFELIQQHVETVGLFRISGNANRVKQMQRLFFCENPEKLPGDTNVHDVCDLIKLFFRTLEEPLISENMQHQFLKCVTSTSVNVTDRVVLELCHVLAPRSRETLAYLMRQLSKIAAHSSSNKMDETNLAVVLALVLFRDDKVHDNVKQRRTYGVRTKAGKAIHESSAAKDDIKLKAAVVSILIRRAYDIGVLSEYEKVMSPSMYNNLFNDENLKEVRSDRRVRVAKVTAERTPVTRNPLIRRKSSTLVQKPDVPIAQEKVVTFASDDAEKTRRSSCSPKKRNNVAQRIIAQSFSVPMKPESSSSRLLRSRSEDISRLNGSEKQKQNVLIGAKIRRGQPNTIRTGLPNRESIHRQNGREKTSEPQTTPLAPHCHNQMDHVDDRDFADSALRELELISSDSSVVGALHPQRCARPSVAIIRSTNRGRVRTEAAKYEANLIGCRQLTKPATKLTETVIR